MGFPQSAKPPVITVAVFIRRTWSRSWKCRLLPMNKDLWRTLCLEASGLRKPQGLGLKLSLFLSTDGAERTQALWWQAVVPIRIWPGSFAALLGATDRHMVGCWRAQTLAHRPGFASWLHHMLVIWLSVTLLLCICFPLCKNGRGNNTHNKGLLRRLNTIV